MNIQLPYLTNIKLGVKIHEYRLATSDRLKIKKDDIIVFKCNKEEIKCEVLGYNVYKDWTSAFKNTENSLNDFKGIFSNFNDIIQAMSKFYKKEDIKKYGIIVYNIKYIN